MRLIAATHNMGKVMEMQEILGELGYEVISQGDAGISEEPEESGKTFEENALIKARAVAKHCDCPVIADDSGLCVDALNGRPGIYSARYAPTDTERIKKLLKELDGCENRSAKFVSAAAVVFPDGAEIAVRGEVHGTILKDPCGHGGFGYDPVFCSDELQKSFGEASAEEKNKISHRGRAFRNLCEVLKTHGERKE